MSRKTDWTMVHIYEFEFSIIINGFGIFYNLWGLDLFLSVRGRAWAVFRFDETV